MLDQMLQHWTKYNPSASIPTRVVALCSLQCNHKSAVVRYMLTAKTWLKMHYNTQLKRLIHTKRRGIAFTNMKVMWRGW